MTAAHNVSLFSEAISTSTTTESDKQTISPRAKNLKVTSEVSDYTDGTYTVTIEHSPDGVNWETLQSLAAQSSAGMLIGADISATNFQFLRASILSASVTTGATIEVKVWHGLDVK